MQKVLDKVIKGNAYMTEQSTHWWWNAPDELFLFDCYSDFCSLIVDTVRQKVKEVNNLHSNISTE